MCRKQAEQSNAQCLCAEAADADDPAAAAPGARARAAALLAMQRSKAAAAAQPDSAPSPAPHQPSDAANGATAAGAAQGSAPPATDAALGGSNGENGANEDDGWGEDVGYGDEPDFPLDQAAVDADVGQDLDHLVPAAQRLWEATSTGEALPPGWAKCPNAGSEVWGLTPIKVRMRALALATSRNNFSLESMWRAWYESSLRCSRQTVAAYASAASVRMIVR